MSVLHGAYRDVFTRPFVDEPSQFGLNTLKSWDISWISVKGGARDSAALGCRFLAASRKIPCKRFLSHGVK